MPVLALNDELAELDAVTSEKVTEHRHARALLSMPGFGGDLAVFETADRFAGLA